jgi:tetratricopeptide (TPR) repeat protein
MEQFQKNTALGADLENRAGTNEEYAQVQALADRGLAAARNSVANSPRSAQAQYMLGSWLTYGYRLVTSQEMVTDAAGKAHATTIRAVAPGLSDDPSEGLEALRMAAQLAPSNATYALEYGAALLDMGQPEEAIVVLTAAWNGKPKLSQQQKARAGLLLADSYYMEGRIWDAREWLYSTLLLNPGNATPVMRLRELDAEEAAMAEFLLPAEAPSSLPPEEATPAAPAEMAPAPAESPSGEAAPEANDGQAAPEEPSESPDQSAAPG